jgi:transposase-like protein
MPPRKSYTAAFKLEAVTYAKENGNRATGHQFSINEKMVRNWRKQEDELRLTKQSKRANRGQKARWPALEDKIETWVLEQRASLRGVKAVTMAEEFLITDFTGGRSWCLRFMRRKQLSIRARTTVCQNLPAEFEEKLSTFRKYCQDKVNDYSIHPDHVINMDEVPLTFYLPMNRTVEKTGSSTISLKTGHEKASFTCVLACTASGIHLPPMLIFKRKTMPKEKFPRGVIIKVNEKGWMSNSMLKSWVTECFAKRPDVFFHLQRAMLVMNSMRAHITDDVKDLLHSVNTTPAVIPGGMTKLLQPLVSTAH